MQAIPNTIEREHNTGHWLSDRFMTKLYGLLLGDWRDCWYELYPLRVLCLFVTCSAIFLCLTVSFAGEKIEKVEDELEIPTEKGSLYLLHGFVKIEMFREDETMVQFVHSLLLRWVLGPVGVLVSLAGTASLMPGFFRSGSAVVVLTSPVNRFGLILSRYLGTLAITFGFAVLFSVSTALALCLATGCWPGFGIAAAVLYTAQLGAFLGTSILLGIWLRRSALVLAGSVLFWVMCQVVNVAYWQAHWQGYTPANTTALALAYWGLPKPADMTLALDILSGASRHFLSLPEIQWAYEMGHLQIWLSLLSSLAHGLVMLALAGWEIRSFEVH